MSNEVGNVIENITNVVGQAGGNSDFTYAILTMLVSVAILAFTVRNKLKK